MDKLEYKGLCKMLEEIYKLEFSSKNFSLDQIQRNLNLSDREDFMNTLRILEEMNLIKVNWRGRIHLTNKGREIIKLIHDKGNFSLPEPTVKESAFIVDERAGESQFKRLMEVDPPATVEVVEILPGNPNIERQLLCIGIIPGVKAEVMAKSRFGGTTILKISGFEVALSRNITHRILVKKL
ncbi:MAG: ferrous iron transport protein A [Candidatus Odinarchaeum yellowstonii]|uniref:Ferrous iron transport protein A n=1 Tax=Odinarchaeota yellowstonii (strain LCB_4) TaxID=1841599 RepID=A0AAF0D2I5_ODILC|nr:MAG: ferrous iron transport protein A [Candidatus Odinarchaeum yellowstonii]